MKYISTFFFLMIIFPLCGQQASMPEVTVCWDASFSMKDRDFEKESAFLDAYFSLQEKMNVTLLIFSDAIRSKEAFEVISGNWVELETRLKEVVYDGATSYEGLDTYVTGEEVLLFTDGHQTLGEVTPAFSAPLHVVNSLKDFNSTQLNLFMIMNQGELHKLWNPGETERENIRPGARVYNGKIYGEEGDSGAISLAIKGSGSEGIRPAADGSYAVEALPGDVLVFTLGGRIVAEKTLGNSRNINVWLESDGGIRLDEVILIEEAFRGEGDTKNTAYGKRNTDAVGYAVQSIGEEEISDISTDVADATQGKFSGVSLGQNQDLSQVELRPKTSILSNNYGLIVIDGVPMPKSTSAYHAYGGTNPQDVGRSGLITSTSFIDPKNIASITVLKSLAATNRFGSLGANGAILITTKTATIQGHRAAKKDMALLTNNLYEERLQVNTKMLTTPYLIALKKGRNVAEAYEIYLEQRDTYWNDPLYLADVYEFFRASSPSLSTSILSNTLEKVRPGITELKALLFKTREHGLPEMELQAAQKIQEQFPENVQSYVDLALAYVHSGNPQLALDMLLRAADGSLRPELEFGVLDKTLDREIRNLLYMHREALDLTKVPQHYLNPVRYNARVMFDWTYPEAQFELQFVNPLKRFFTWEHTTKTNSKRLRDELERGYGIEEFEIFGEGVAGKWLINARYLGNLNVSDTTPLLLRCRIDYNFGKPGQHSVEKVIRLQETGEETQVVELQVK